MRETEPRLATAATKHDEVQSLQAQIRDLAALLALPGMWRGREIRFIAGSLLDALVSLLRVDLAYIRLETPSEGDALEDSRPLPGLSAGAAGLALEFWHALRDAPAAPMQAVPGRGMMRVVRLHPRLERERAVIIVCSDRADFPTEVESFLLRTTVDQGMVALEGSRLMREFQEANRAKSAFLATMSHELRTPLNAILGYVDLLDAEVAGALNPWQRQSLARVRAGSHHLLVLIEGILNFARIDAGKEQVHHERVDLNVLVLETVALVEPLARSRHLDVVVQTPDESQLMDTDPSKVRQIVLNLLSNAVKFTHTGSITVELRRFADHFRISVRDTGIGIASEDRERVFEPFRQVGNVYTQKSTGTGLGLSVSRQLARLLGGDVTVESEVARGSEFTLTLPAA